MNVVSRPWKPQDLLDDLQMYIDEEPDNYLNGRRTTMCMARDYLKAYFETGLTPEDFKSNVDIDYVRIIELLKADAEGRLVVLPYQPGQVVWVVRSQTSNGKNLYLREERIARYVISECDVAMCFESGRVSVSKWHWETSVFLTREEAEAALVADKNVGSKDEGVI